jgi:hypothetical protein
MKHKAENSKRRAALKLVLSVVFAFFAIIPNALAQDYPSRVVTLVSLFLPGGPVGGITGRHRLGWHHASAAAFWADVVKAATQYLVWQAELARLSRSPLV